MAPGVREHAVPLATERGGSTCDVDVNRLPPLPPSGRGGVADAAGVVTITAKELGPNGNDIATTESGTGTSFGAATLTGGRNIGGVKPIGVLPQAVALGATGTLNAPTWYSGCFNRDALVWHGSYDSNAKKEAAFRDAPTPTNIIVAVRGA